MKEKKLKEQRFSFPVTPLQVVQSGLTMSSRDYYLGNETSKYHKAFVNYFTDISVLLGAKKKSARLVAENIWELETNIATVSIEREVMKDFFLKMSTDLFQLLYDFGTCNSDLVVTCIHEYRYLQCIDLYTACTQHCARI